MTPTPLLSLNGIDTFYGESHILHGVTFDVFPGEIIGILGRNGVGKTTTLQTILGIPAPRTGSIHFRGQLISNLPTFDIVTRGIGWVPQGHRIFPTLTVVETPSIRHSRACMRVAMRAAMRCPAASSRCSRSRGPSCRTRTSSSWMSRRKG
jgi:ABC-type branched-subunit amino acid transport system ATPase component